MLIQQQTLNIDIKELTPCYNAETEEYNATNFDELVSDFENSLNKGSQILQKSYLVAGEKLICIILYVEKSEIDKANQLVKPIELANISGNDLS